MSNRRRSRVSRATMKALRPPKCPKCKQRGRRSKEYADAWLHICTNPKCQFPVREVK